MKLFKKIYFPVVSALLAIFLIFSILDASGVFISSPLDSEKIKEHVAMLGTRNSESQNRAAADYILSAVTSAGAQSATSTVNSLGHNEATIYRANSGEYNPTSTKQEVTLTSAEIRRYYEEQGIDSPIHAETTLNNIVVILPANTANATRSNVTIMTAYDSHATTYGASANASSVGSMIETIRELRNQSRSTDLVFVFYDGGTINDLGAYAYFLKFRGFLNSPSNTKLVVNFNASGNSGTFAVNQVKLSNSEVITSLAKSGVYTSSVIDVFRDYFAPINNFSGSNNTVNITTTGGKENLNTNNDSEANLTDAFVRQNASAVYNIASHYANSSIDFSTDDNDLVYYSYLGFIRLVYSTLVAMILLVLIVGLIATIVVFNIKLKAFGFVNVAWGALASLCALLSAVAALFVVYLLLALIYSAYGMFSIHNLFALSYSSIGLSISAIFASLTVSIGFSMLFKNVFNVKATDMMYGNIAITAVLALFFGMLVPQIAFSLVALSTLQLIMVLCTTLLRARFKEKYKADINRLFLVFIPLLIAIPLLVPTVIMSGYAIGAVYYPLIYAVIVLAIGSVAPFFGMLNPIFDKVAKKLPHMTRRVLTYEDKQVESGTGKNKKVETVKVKKIVNQKRPVNYHHSFGVIVLSIICTILLLCTSIGGNIHTNYAANNRLDPFYENALVYHRDKDTNRAYWKVADLDIASRLMGIMDDLKYDRELGMYIKEDITTDKNLNSAFPTVTHDALQRRMSIRPMDPHNSFVTLDISFNAAPTNIKVMKSNGDYIIDLDLASGTETLSLQLPSGMGTFDIILEGSFNMNINYTEKNSIANTFSAYSEWKKINEKNPALFVDITPRFLLTATTSFSV